MEVCHVCHALMYSPRLWFTMAAQFSAHVYAWHHCTKLIILAILHIAQHPSFLCNQYPVIWLTALISPAQDSSVAAKATHFLCRRNPAMEKNPCIRYVYEQIHSFHNARINPVSLGNLQLLMNAFNFKLLIIFYAASLTCYFSKDGRVEMKLDWHWNFPLVRSPL